MHEFHILMQITQFSWFSVPPTRCLFVPLFAKSIWVRIEKSRRVVRGGNGRRRFNCRERKGGKEKGRRGKARFAGEPLQVIFAILHGFEAIFAGLRSPTCTGFSLFFGF
jgi:hypothetical protein